MANLNRKRNLLERFVEYPRLTATKCKDQVWEKEGTRVETEHSRLLPFLPLTGTLPNPLCWIQQILLLPMRAAAGQPSALNLITLSIFLCIIYFRLKVLQRRKWLTIGYVLILNISE